MPPDVSSPEAQRPIQVDWRRNSLRAFAFLRPYWPLGLVSAFATLLLIGVGLLAPWPMKIVVDSVLQDEPLPGFVTPYAGDLADDRLLLLGAVVAAGFCITLLSDCLGMLTTYLNTRIDVAMTLDFRSRLFQHAQRLSMSFHDNRKSGMVIYVINAMASSATQLVMMVLPLAQNVLTLVGMFWISYTISPTLALVALAVVPILYWSLAFYTRHIQQRIYGVKMLEGETLAIIHEAVSMLRVIVAFGGEEREFGRFHRQGERANAARIDVTVRQALFSLSVNATIAAGTAAVLGTGAYLALQGRITIGDLLIVLAYIASVYTPLASISSTIGSLQDQFISLQMAFDMLDMEPDVTDAPDAIAIERARGEVVFEGVSFNYSSRTMTLADVSFTLQTGTVTAIVGPTGAGKSTIISLLVRFYQHKQGTILLDGVDIERIRLRSLRQQMSLVLQETLLFSTSVAENIHYGRVGATREEIVEAAKAANAHDFIMALPQQYDTLVGERGAQLSGGERQRIAIARAFLKDAPLLILDEPTSAIDSRTESVILDALDRLMVGRTTLLVTHRLSALRRVDQILVLNDGQVVERGSHETLLAQGGLYHQLHEMQLGRRRGQILAGSLAPAGT